MKIVVNKCYGGFGMTEDFYNTFYGGYVRVLAEDRANEELIANLEHYGVDKASKRHADLCIVDIPDNATDWKIVEYDGLEYIMYVVDGKIYEA